MIPGSIPEVIANPSVTVNVTVRGPGLTGATARQTFSTNDRYVGPIAGTRMMNAVPDNRVAAMASRKTAW